VNNPNAVNHQMTMNAVSTLPDTSGVDQLRHLHDMTGDADDDFPFTQPDSDDEFDW
jgi:hypothetical protein